MKSPDDLHLADVLARLSPLHRDLLCSMGRADGLDSEDVIAQLHGLTPRELRHERSLARRRLRALLDGESGDPQ